MNPTNKQRQCKSNEEKLYSGISLRHDGSIKNSQSNDIADRMELVSKIF